MGKKEVNQEEGMRLSERVEFTICSRLLRLWLFEQLSTETVFLAAVGALVYVVRFEQPEWQKAGTADSRVG